MIKPIEDAGHSKKREFMIRGFTEPRKSLKDIFVLELPFRLLSANS